MFDKIFLHVGLGKTGTSYLQNCLDALSRNNELVCTSYPVLNGNLDFVKIQSGNGEAIAFQLLKKKVPEFHEATVAALVKTFVETADKTKPSLLMSSEHFCSADPDRFRFLTQLLLTYARKVEIIIFVRPLDELCHSRYHQQVKRHSHSLAYDGRPRKLSATPDLSGAVLPLCLIPNSALKNAPPFKSVMPKA